VEPTVAPPGRASRREFFKWWVNGTIAVIATTLAVPLAGFYLLPALRRPRTVWNEIGPVEEFPEGEMRLVALKPLERRRWPESWGREAAWVVNRGNRFVAFNTHCTHVGCPVQWSPQARSFFSPCHGGAFDADGRVLAGPPPRPLDRYETRVEKGVVYAGPVYRVNERLERAG
jgi:menaquinol-cytochrome c reductase iron-sulfur subunit